MPTQRLGEKRVEEHVGERERKRERERKSARRRRLGGGRKGEREGFGSSFYVVFPPPGPALCKLGLARSAVCYT